MTIAFYPNFNNNINDYVNAVVDALKIASPKVTVIPFPSTKDIITGKIKFDIAWLNWYENLPSSKFLFFKKFIIKIILIIFFKIKQIKIYSVFHNKKPHESIYPSLNLWFYKFLLKKSNKIIILNDKSKYQIKALIGPKGVKKVIKISHPSYKLRKRIPKNYGNFTVLFWGILRPYKNIELILKLAKKNPDIKFIIAGNPIDEKFCSCLLNESKKIPNVNIVPKFLENDEIGNLIDLSTIMMLPYNINSSLNSGVLFYALSNAINVIIPEIGSVDEINNKNLLYTYTYTNETEHLQKLENALLIAYEDFKTNPDEFYIKEIKLQEEVAKFSTDYIASQIQKANLLN